MEIFHLLHHERLARYDTMYPCLLALAGVLAGLDSGENILWGLYQIVTTEDALITDYVRIAGVGAALVNSALVTGIAVSVLYLSGDRLNGMTMVEIGLMAGFSLFGKNFINNWPILMGAWLYA